MLSNILRLQSTSSRAFALGASLLPRSVAFSTSSVARRNTERDRTVFVGNVMGFRYDTVRNMLKERGFDAARIRRGGSAYGHVELATPQEADRLLQLHSEEPVQYRGKTLRMERVNPETKVGEPFPVLRVRGLPLEATPAQIAALLEVSESKITFVEVDTALVETESIERATKMLEAITSEPKSLAGHTLEISYAKSVVDPPSTDLYIHMSDPALPADELRALFGEFESSITDVRQLKDDSTRVWISFVDIDAATAAREALNCKTFGTTKLVLNYARPRLNKKSRSG